MKKCNILITMLLTSMLVLSPLANVQAATVSAGTGNAPSFLHTGSGGSSASGQSVQADLFSGAATYSVKLPVPPATGGVQPNLILNYNSQRKNPNSIMGYGWDLELGSIQRKPETNGIVDFEEGTSYEVRFAGQSESLVLVDGNVSASDYGLSVGSGVVVDLYQAQIESAFNVYLHMYETTNGSYSNGRNDLGWIVIDKKGYRYAFGTDTNSLVHYTVEDDLGAETQYVSKWNLDYVEDTNGNTMSVSYNSDKFPREINYQDVSIDFDYENISADTYTHYPVHKQYHTDPDQIATRLEEITIEDSGRLQKYEFNYETSNYNYVQYLSQIKQYGATDSEYLPPITLDYYDIDESEYGFDSTPLIFQASHTSPSSDYNPGEIGDYAQFLDMNGDGLLDHVVSYQNNNTIYVYFNDGNGFQDRGSASEWVDPLYSDICDWDSSYCGKLTAFDNVGYQHSYLMDVNGDFLPDRVFMESDGDVNHAFFKVAYNTGKGFSTTITQWRDPFVGHATGAKIKKLGFLDMNGDGLVDRVEGSDVSDNFHIFYNYGAGWLPDSYDWYDPILLYGEDNNRLTNITTTDGEQVVSEIRDVNGDGLPDRTWKMQCYEHIDDLNEDGDFEDEGESIFLGGGFHVEFNKYGTQWNIPDILGSRVNNDGVNNTALLDDFVTEDTAWQGAKTAWLDWIDMNGDGMLDRVVGDRDNGEFTVYFYKGLYDYQDYSYLTKSLEIVDPVQDATGQFAAQGYITTRDSQPLVNSDYHTFFIDLTGDGFPDRVSLDERTLTEDNKVYKVYPLRVHPLEMTDTHGVWDDDKVNQPIGALRSVNDGRGHEIEIEYMPSTKTKRNDAAIPNHRYLPYNIYTVHKIFVKDYTISGDDGTVESARHPDMRYTTYDFWGGNLYVNKAVKASADIDDHTLTNYYQSAFNGFQTVEKTIAPFPSETWDTIIETTRFHQAEGDVDVLQGSYASYFDSTGYTEFSLSGRSYYYLKEAGNKFLTRKTLEWDSVVLDATLGIDRVTLTSQTNTSYDLANSNTKVATTAYTYDDDGNILTEILSDNSGSLLTKTKTYYPDSHFDSDLMIRDRVETYTISHGGQDYRYFQYDYDNLGNQDLMEQQEDAGGATFATTTRVFDGYGNVEQEIGPDGVTVTYGYDSDGMFPVEDTVNLPTGGQLYTGRSYDRLTGKIKAEYNDAGTGTRVVYDSFGRVVEEYAHATDGQDERTKAIDYTYEQQSVGGQNVTVLKTQIWEPQTGHSSTNDGNSESQITYTDPFGHLLQSCQYTERGNYRKVITRMEDGGYTVNATEPAFTTECAFSETYSSPYVQTTKDALGRTVSVEPPAGDAGSPVDSIGVGYSLDAQGYLTKTTTSSGRSIVEEYDTQNRLVTKTDPNNISLTYEYSPVGELEEVYQGGNLMTSVSYDMLGRKLSSTDTNLGTWHYNYNTEGLLETQTDNMGQYVSIDYDSVGRVIQKNVYDASSALEKYDVYTYDIGDGSHDVGDGELFKVEEFDSAGALLRTTRYGYDSLFRYKNRITRTIDGNEYQQDISKDFRGLTQDVTYPGGESFYYSYDATGKIQTVCGQESCSTQYYTIDSSTAYNERGQLEEESFGNGVTTSFSHFANSHRLESMAVSKGGENYTQRSYTYDSRSNILSIGDGEGLTGTGALSNVGYDDVNRLTDYTLTDGATTNAFSYDDQGNMLTNGKVYGSDVYQYTSGKPHAVTEIGSELYTYDDNGNMLTDPSRQMTYNALNQLSQVVMTNGTTINFDYDYSGHRVSKVATSVDQYGQTITATTYYLGDVIKVREGNLLLKLYANDKKIVTKSLGSIEDLFAAASYSRPTNITMAGLSGSGALNLGLFGLMLAFFLLMRPVTWRLPLRAVYLAHRRSRIYRLVYEALRTYRIVARGFQEAFYAFPQQAMCKVTSLALIFLFVFSFPVSQAYAGDEGVPPGEISDETYTYYHHGDHLGSSHLVTEGNPSGGKHNGIFYNSGDLIQRIEYYPFGEEKYVLNPNLDLDPSYTGQQYDRTSGLYYYKSRYYNPRIARFIQADTMIPDAENLQSYNRYSYVENNPLKYTDPTGHFSVGFGGSNMMGGGIGLSQEFIGIILSGPGNLPTEGLPGNMANRESAGMAAVAKSDQSAVTALIEKVKTFIENYELHEVDFLVKLKQKRNEIRFKFLTETLGDAGALLYMLSDMYIPDLMPTTWEGVIGTTALACLGSRFFGRAGAAGGSRKAIVIGENMQAIKSTAKSLQKQGVNAKWYQSWSKNWTKQGFNKQANMDRNLRWIKTKTKQGYDIFDIGKDPTRPIRSDFYKLEIEYIESINYPTTTIPRP